MYGANLRHSFLYAALWLPITYQDFMYTNFRNSKGIVLNGAAKITESKEFSSSSITSIETPHNDQHFMIETTSSDIERSVCTYRIRLTPSRPWQVSSVFYAKALPIFQGFESEFVFQITDQSKRCYTVFNQNVGGVHQQRCHIRGGDGFAFVLHGNEDKQFTLGSNDPRNRANHSNLGYEGIGNLLAVEFDTLYGPDFASDTPDDHVTVYFKGPSFEHSKAMTAPAHVSLSDGHPHHVTIRYFRDMQYDLLPYFSVTSASEAFLQDLSENRRIGTLAIYVDHTPILALPINLATALYLETDCAFLGFTASTSDFWQHHEILSWRMQYAEQVSEASDSESLLDYTTKNAHDLNQDIHYPDTRPWTSSRHRAPFSF